MVILRARPAVASACLATALFTTMMVVVVMLFVAPHHTLVLYMLYNAAIYLQFHEAELI